MNKASLQDWLARLEQLHPVEIELGLARVAEVARRLDLLPLATPAVVVAGTNGKGSTVAVLEALCQETGLRAGAYTSPHLERFNERIRVDGEEATDEAICEAFAAIDAARGDVSLTYFEFGTLAALYLFRAAKLDLLLLEVGLGGRLDAVNIVDADVAVITSIALDHQDWLGDDIGGIAREKAGVLRAARAVVVSDPSPPPELGQCIAEVGASPVLRLGTEYRVEEGAGDWSLSFTRQEQQVDAGPFARSGLLPGNVAGAIQAFAALGHEASAEQIARAVALARPAGRRQTEEIDGRQIVLDVAHNPAAVERLVEFLGADAAADTVGTNPARRTIAVFSIMSDKDSAAMAAAAGDAFDAWFLADQPANPRAARAADLADVLRQAGQGMISVSKNLRQAYRRAQTIAAEGDRVVVFGSFFTVAEVLPLLAKDRRKQGKVDKAGE